MSFGLSQVGPLFPQLLEKHPCLRLDLRFEDRLVDLLAEGIDLAIRAGVRPPDSPFLSARRIATLQRVLCAAPGFLPVIVGFTASTIWPACPACCRARRRPSGRFRRRTACRKSKLMVASAATTSLPCAKRRWQALAWPACRSGSWPMIEDPAPGARAARAHHPDRRHLRHLPPQCPRLSRHQQRPRLPYKPSYPDAPS